MEKVFAVIFQISRFSRSNSRYRGYRGHFPDIAIATAKFPISRYRDDRELSVCLLPIPPISEYRRFFVSPEISGIGGADCNSELKYD